MERLYKIYAVTSVLFLVILVLSPIKDIFNEWRKIQGDYKRYLKQLPEEFGEVEKGLQQIWVQDLNRIDRCPTCHLSIDSNSKNLPKLFRKHPNVYHDSEKFGCTICHDGQGLATNFEDAHIPSEHWDRPILPNKYLDSACGRCHINDNLKETPVLNRGQKLTHDLKCVGCHELPDKDPIFTFSLEGIGKKIKNKNWLIGWLQNPKSFRSNTKMPNFFLSVDEATKLTDFLMSFQDFPNNYSLEPLPEIYTQQKDNEDFIQTGTTLFREASCISCHSVRGVGGNLAVELADVASKATDQWIFNFIKNPKLLQPGIEMPQFGFSTREIAAITAYISSDFVDWDASKGNVIITDTTSENSYEQGKSIFYQYNCIGCHQSSSIDVEEFPGPELLTIGSKKIYKIYFGDLTIPHTLYDFIETNLKTPRAFGETMRMPDNNLSFEDRHAITTYLLSLHEEEFPQKYMSDKSKTPAFDPKGRMGTIFRKYNCLKCHSIWNSGGELAPDLSLVGNRLQRNWIVKFLKTPYSIRPGIEERMLKLSIANEEIETILDYFYSILADDSLSIPIDFDNSRQAQNNGKRLFWETYGCQGCHMINGEGGVLGPSLDNVSYRLQPLWIYHWIKNPQKYIPDTIEPRSGMSEDEIKQVVSYLINL